MPDINELGLPPEEVGVVDYDAPESGTFPPSLPAFSRHSFIFELEDDPFSTIEIDGKKYLAVAFKARTTVTDPQTQESREVDLRYQRVNFYKHPKVPNSSAGELIRALGLRFSGPLSPQLIAQEFQQISGRATFTGEVGWRAYCKGCELEIATHTRKKRVKEGKQVEWPRENGQLPEQAACPKCGSRYFGNAEVVRYILPTAAAGAA